MRAACLLACALACLAAGGAQRAEQLLAQNPCSSKATCSECIRTPSCAWCYEAAFDRARCFNPAMENGTNGCNEAYIFNPDNQRITDPDYNRPLSRAKGRMYEYEEQYEQQASSSASGYGMAGAAGAAGASAEGNLVQIKPQRIKLQLRMNQVESLSVQYSQAEDYPVDLYYLMDLSKSMENDKDSLSRLGSLLASTMRNITSNFRLGFGSFVDKVVMPYVSTVPKNLISPCNNCTAPYGFKNQMSLSMDTDHFEDAVKRADVSGNLDAPEGGFDAVMQAVVCRAQIGWREQARRLLVFSTDAGFHYAGDGKLGGIVQPNDGECHLEGGRYTHSTLQDYPSIAQINHKVKEHKINVIFAVTHDQISIYEALSRHIEGSTAGILSNDSSNVVDLVRNQYNKITSSVEMKDNSSNAVQVVYYSRCRGTELLQTNKCDGLKVGDVVEFTAEITLKECPADPRDWRQTFTLYPVGVSESLRVELDMLCDCPCEHPGHPAYDESPLACMGHGVSACGTCACAAGFYGAKCECSDQGTSPPELERACRKPGSDRLCSGRGVCECGRCQCNKPTKPGEEVTGTYCECDNFTCDQNQGVLCSGHGACKCGKCVCDDDYTGTRCDCLKSQEPCRSPENGEICSGNGKCVCGQCQCTISEERQYSGRFCEKCPTCPGKCREFKDCVLCEVHARGPLYAPDAPLPDRCGNCSLHPVLEDGKIEANESLNEHLCSFYDDEDCLYVYVYSFSPARRLLVRAQRERECPPKVFILGIVLGVIAAIVLVGLALLMLWKMVTTIHDRREFARFEKERMAAKWDTGENPIYKQATSTFKNPTYVGK